MSGEPCVVGVAEHAGWAHLISVATAGGTPIVIDRRRVTLIDAGLPTMPYHHESLGMAVGEANALIARVRTSIAGHSARALRDLIADLAPAHAVVAIAIRKATFPELPGTVAVVRQSYRLQCAADGMMYQLAICRAARDLDLAVHEYRRGEEMLLAAGQLDASAAAVASFVSNTGRPSGPPWTEEHRRAYAAGIALLAGLLPGRIRIHEPKR